MERRAGVGRTLDVTSSSRAASGAELAALAPPLPPWVRTMCYIALRADAPVPAVWQGENVRRGVVAEIRFLGAVLPEQRAALESQAEGRYGRGVLLEWVDVPPPDAVPPDDPKAAPGGARCSERRPVRPPAASPNVGSDRSPGSLQVFRLRAATQKRIESTPTRSCSRAITRAQIAGSRYQGR
jgi:hypothetical protein